MKTAVLYSWAVALLGLFAGGCISILFIVVPFLFTLPAQNLMEWVTDFGPTVGRTMLPMEIAPLVLSVFAYFKTRKYFMESSSLWLLIKLSNILILLSFFIYFLPVKLSFLWQSLPESAAALCRTYGCRSQAKKNIIVNLELPQIYS